MSLQVRLRHALGERLFDLPDRPAENPLIFGRAREADVKVPSVTVATKHCALFLHDEQWVLQDTSGGSTWVNGEAVVGPTLLNIGDTITLGADATPVTVEVDPEGVLEGRGGQPAQTTETVEAPPVAVAPPPVRRGPSSPAPRQPGGYYSAPQAPPPLMPIQQPGAVDDGWGSVPAANDAMEGWGQDESASTTPAVRKKKPAKKNSDVGIFIGVGISVLIVAGVGFAVYKHMNPDVPPPVVVKTVTQSAPAKPQGMFSEIENHGPSDDGGTAASPPPKAAPVVRPKEMESPDAGSGDANATPAPDSADAHKDDKGWDDVEAANNSQDIGKAIIKFDDYRQQHPGKNVKELDDYTDDAMDRLWWQRIVQLCGRRDSIKKDIKQSEKDIREETNAKFKQTLQGEKKTKEDALALVMGHLTAEMGYTSEETPNVDDRLALAKLKDERDAGKFGAWKIKTLKYIRSQHGAKPWDGE